jgi:hypothetical protein
MKFSVDIDDDLRGPLDVLPYGFRRHIINSFVIKMLKEVNKSLDTDLAILRLRQGRFTIKIDGE